MHKAGFSSTSEPIGPQDDESVDTASTSSLSCDTEDSDYDKRVSFAEDLVTEEWTREYTPKEDIATLYYSSEELQAFRQDYRLERKLISDLSIDVDDLAEETELFSNLVSCKRQSQFRHQISRVVVCHGNKLQMFSEEALSADHVEFDDPAFWTGNLTWF